MKPTPNLDRVAKAQFELLCRDAREGRILAFTKATFPGYKINWHHRLIAKYIDKLLSGEIKRLMIFTPPRHGKSELTSRRLPALIHGLFPNDEILAFSYNGELASDMCVDVQRIMDRPSYKKIFPKVRIPPPQGMIGRSRTGSEHEIIPYIDPITKRETIFEGSYNCSGVGGTFTGKGGDWILGDDPIKNRADADSKAFRTALWNFWTSTIRTRLEKDARILLTQTRWHDDDLAGRLIKLMKEDPEADQWVILNIPAIKETDDFAEDPRQIGEPLWPWKYDLKELLTLKASSSRDWSALYQGSPVAEGGNIIKENQFKFWTPANLPASFDHVIQSWDFAVKDKETSDFVVGQVWGMKGADKYLLAQFRKRTDFPGSCAAVENLTAEFPNARRKYVEAKANGPAVVQSLRKKISGFIELEPRGDKVARVHAVSPEFESGNVYIPDPSLYPWVKDYISELISFPTGVHDDQVDATSQALDKLIGLEIKPKPRAIQL